MTSGISPGLAACKVKSLDSHFVSLVPELSIPPTQRGAKKLFGEMTETREKKMGLELVL